MGSEAQAVAAISLLHAEVRAVGVAILEETAAARCRAVERQAGGVAGVLSEEQLIGIAVGFDGGEVGLRRTGQTATPHTTGSENTKNSATPNEGAKTTAAPTGTSHHSSSSSEHKPATPVQSAPAEKKTED